MPFVLSDQQQAIVDAIAANDKDVEAQARAGTGKTTTILLATEEARGSVAFFAFNKAIERELKKRASPRVNVQTLHSFGFRVLRSHFESVQLEEDKTYGLMVQILGREPDKKWVYPVQKLTSLSKNTLSDTDPETLQEMADEYDVDIDPGVNPNVIFDLVAKVIEAGTPSSGDSEIVIDFDDMVYLPAKLDWLQDAVPTFDWVFVDESQDMNPPQHRLVLAAAAGGRICYVGDPYQAIYRFRGADSRSMETMRSALTDKGREVVVLPLTKTRRCPKAIVKVAQQWVPDIEALPDAPEGTVRYIERDQFDAQHGDMVICRLNGPVVRAAYMLLKQGKRARIQGRDLGMAIVNLIRKFNAPSMEDLDERLTNYHAREAARIQRTYASKPTKMKNHLGALQDKVDVVRALMENYDTVPELIMQCQNLFTDDGNVAGAVLCSSVHKAKGLEADRVWILESGFRGSGEQEDNIKYVAATRAKRELVYVNWEERL